MTTTILFYGLLAACAEIAGGSLVIRQNRWPQKVQEFFLAIGAGFLLALVFVELVPESLQAVGATAPLYMLAGYAVLHFFEHTVVGHLHFGEETHREVMVSRVASLSTFTGLLIHAFFDGFSISVGMQFDFGLGLLVFVAVLLHKIPEGLTIASVMLAARHERRTVWLTVWLANVAVGGATMLGVIAPLLFTGADEGILGGAFAFSAGAATYVGASDLIPEINHSRNRIIPVMVFVGMLLFYLGMTLVHALVGRGG
jgi:zinc transporter ZupT